MTPAKVENSCSTSLFLKVPHEEWPCSLLTIQSTNPVLSPLFCGSEMGVSPHAIWLAVVFILRQLGEAQKMSPLKWWDALQPNKTQECHSILFSLPSAPVPSEDRCAVCWDATWEPGSRAGRTAGSSNPNPVTAVDAEWWLAGSPCLPHYRQWITAAANCDTHTTCLSFYPTLC